MALMVFYWLFMAVTGLKRLKLKNIDRQNLYNNRNYWRLRRRTVGYIFIVILMVITICLNNYVGTGLLERLFQSRGSVFTWLFAFGLVVMPPVWLIKYYRAYRSGDPRITTPDAKTQMIWKPYIIIMIAIDLIGFIGMKYYGLI